MTIPGLYIYIDEVVFPLWAFIGIAFAFHFLGNILTGRAAKRFIRWEWPAHDHIPPLAPRIAHLTHVICMFVLAITGLYIHLPFAAGDGLRTGMRYAHYVAMVIVTLNLIYRLWYAFFSKNRDFREFGLRWIDIKAMPATVLYYIFVANDKPHLSKYNPMQRMTYTLFPALLIVQAFTGFAIAFPTLFFSWGSAWFGMSAAAAWTRLAHYVINWLFIILTTIHVYLSITEDLPAFILFFFQIPPKHHDEGGHEEHEKVKEPTLAPEMPAGPAPAYAGPTSYQAPVYQPGAPFGAPPQPAAPVVDAALLRDYLNEMNARMADMENLLRGANGSATKEKGGEAPTEEEPW